MVADDRTEAMRVTPFCSINSSSCQYKLHKQLKQRISLLTNSVSHLIKVIMTTKMDSVLNTE